VVHLGQRRFGEKRGWSFTVLRSSCAARKPIFTVKLQYGIQLMTDIRIVSCFDLFSGVFCVKSAFDEMIYFCTKQSNRVDTREWNHTEMIRFCTERFGCAESCITPSHGLDSFPFQTCLVRYGAKMIHLFRWFTFALSKPCRRESKTCSTRVDCILHEIQMRWYGGKVNQH